MKTTVLTQKKFIINLKECKDINTFLSELTLLIKTLKEQKDKGYNLVQAQVDGLKQMIEVAITTNKQGSTGAAQSLSQSQNQSKQNQQNQKQQQDQKKRFSLGGGNKQQNQQQPPRPQQ